MNMAQRIELETELKRAYYRVQRIRLTEDLSYLSPSEIIRETYHLKQLAKSQ